MEFRIGQCPYLIPRYQAVQDALTPFNPATYHYRENRATGRFQRHARGAPMATIQELKEQYEGLDRELPAKGEEVIDTACRLPFEYV